MKRRVVLPSIAAILAAPWTMNLSDLKNITDGFAPGPRMPVIFVGHGSPMNALEDNAFTRGWKEVAKKLPVPKAILCVSAHWLTQGTKVTAMAAPPTIHDFGGFPQELFDVQYPAPGSPEFALEAQKLATKTHIELDHKWGLDHGTWSVLKVMYPEARIPVFQLSLDYYQPGMYHYELARELKSLREKGVLIVGSGNIVHNLRMINFRNPNQSFDWAAEFDAKSKQLIETRDIKALADYQKLGQAAALSIPTPDHYFPLIYALGVTEEKEEIHFFNEHLVMGSISMRSLVVG
ncbi:MAG: 4,5-DOPA dioxygenase extradiol [Bacteroidia bacterium]